MESNPIDEIYGQRQSEAGNTGVRHGDVTK